MKRILCLLLACLLLSGCAADVPDPTAPESIPATEETVISHDALELLEFDDEDVYAAAPMGDDLLLFSGMDQTTLIKISGRDYTQIASVSTDVSIVPDHPAVRISESGVCYTTGAEYIFLNENLEEVQRVSLPDAWGLGVVAADQQTIYYSTGSELRAYDRRTGLDRLLRETMYTTLSLTSLQLSDSVLVCQLLDQGTSPTQFYSAATGELLGTCEDSVNLTSAGETWLAKTSDGSRNQIIFGGTGEPSVLNGWETFSDVMLVSGGILIRGRTDGTAVIRFLDPTAGTEAAAELDTDAYIMNAWNDGGILWIALDDGHLLRWELADTGTQAVSCVTPYYSRETPDTEGLAALAPVIADLEAAYGVAIHIYEDAVAVQPAEMTLDCEYQVDVLTEALNALELALSRFPQEFLAELGSVSHDERIHICLIRAVSGSGCIQFWDEDGNVRIALAADGDLERNFYHGIGHIIDTHVLTACGAFDNWKRLNPSGFSYDDPEDRDISDFPGAFADPRGMTSPVEDRAWVFASAMLEDPDGLFDSQTMQQKLSTLCTGIRKTFRPETGTVLPWEQHLDQ